MPTNFGGTPIANAYLGTVPAQRVMLGNTEVWSLAVYPLEQEWSGVVSTATFPPPSLSHTARKRVLLKITASYALSEQQPTQLTFTGRWWSLSWSNHDGSLYLTKTTTQAFSPGEKVDLVLRTTTPRGTTQAFWEVEELGPYALVNSTPDQWFPLDFSDNPYMSRGPLLANLNFESGTPADRGSHLYVATAKLRTNVVESWDNGWTMAGWFQKTGAGGTGGESLLSRGSTTAGREVRFYLEPDGVNGRLRFEGGSSSTITSVLVPDVFTRVNTWRHVAITCEIIGGRPTLRLFLDGVAVRERTAVSNFGFTREDWVSFGNCSNNLDNQPFNGNIDDLALWSRPLTSTEIADIFREGRISIS